MARALRINYPDAFYHVTSRGNEGKNVFKSHRDREKFVEYLRSSSERYDAVIHAFCLMDNHYHLLVQTPSANLPQIMRHINGSYTTYYNIKRKRSGHLFQGRYKAILVDIDEYAKELSRYIHLNPARANLVERPEKYKWSSYKFYIGQQKAPEWLHRDFILGYFGKKISSAQKAYQRFVNAMIDKPYANPLKDVVGSTLLGSSDFIDFIKDAYIVAKREDKELPALRLLTEKTSMQNIFAEVDIEFGDQQVLARNIKIYLCRRYTAEKLMDIASHFGIGESGVSQAYKRISQKLTQDKKLKKNVEKIELKLNLSRVKT
ncbi:MAG: transposase [Desulfobacterales bacterium]|jgi:REP element-mobilizing transposase RayT